SRRSKACPTAPCLRTFSEGSRPHLFSLEWQQDQYRRKPADTPAVLHRCCLDVEFQALRSQYSQTRSGRQGWDRFREDRSPSRGAYLQYHESRGTLHVPIPQRPRAKRDRRCTEEYEALRSLDRLDGTGPSAWTRSGAS